MTLIFYFILIYEVQLLSYYLLLYLIINDGMICNLKQYSISSFALYFREMKIDEKG